MTGHVEITEVGPGHRFDYIVSMDEGKHQMDCEMSVVPADGGSLVNWLCEGDSGGNPLNRLAMAAYKPMIGQDFDKGLVRLKQRYAKQP